MDVSYLYTPALKVDSSIAHQENISADVIVVDLEDSTHINAKDRARRKIAETDFTPLLDHNIKLGLRINTLAGFDGLQDLLMIRALQASWKMVFTHIFIPKIRRHNEVQIYKSLLRVLPVMPKVYTFIETVDAVEHADEIASVSDALCFGEADLVSEMYSANDTYLNYARARMCISAAKYHIPSIDTNSFDIKNMANFEQECVRSRGYGFTAKAAIHPNQVPIINKIFAVSNEVDRYESFIRTYVNSECGFVIRDGEVIAPPFVAKAQRMLSLYKKD